MPAIFYLSSNFQFLIAGYVDIFTQRNNVEIRFETRFIVVFNLDILPCTHEMNLNQSMYASKSAVDFFTRKNT